MKKRFNEVYVAALSCMFFSCHKKSTTLFTALDPSVTNIQFENKIVETKDLNIITYQYLYNGGGVAVGDINNDGLPDIFFTGNEVNNKLYLNNGKFNFTDITAQAKIFDHKGWKTGVTMADVNGDGWLDIYVCYSGPGTDSERVNQLFINNGCKKGGVPTFTERAKEYGLDAPGTFSTQAVFFDYDHDGDLDMFLLNHSNKFYSSFYNTKKLRETRDPYYGNKLFRNDGGHFVDVSEQAGIKGSKINFGLGVAVADVNNDGYPDIYVTNDWDEQDFLYLNNRNGTFSEVSDKAFGHMSKYSMGVDIADYNNDSKPDIVTLDMLPEDNHRQKLLKGPDDYNRYQLAVNSGFKKQQMRNMLQLNQGLGSSGIPVFSEIGQLAGVSNTDWSWSPLFADFDNDGYKDLFITNGFLRDFTNMDFIKYDFALASENAWKNQNSLYTPDGAVHNKKVVFDLVKKMPSTKVHNYIFKNNGDLTFTNKINDWGFAKQTVSAGAAYADLDNNGNLDLIVNNSNEKATIYKNNGHELSLNHFLGVRLKGAGKNRFAIGAKVYLTSGNKTQYLEQNPTRGFQSSVDYVLHFGLGRDTLVKNIKVIFPSGKEMVQKNVKADRIVSIDELQANEPEFIPVQAAKKKIFKDISLQSGINFIHQQNDFVDFSQQYLIPDQPSKQGPKISKADVNNDGLEDIFIGGSSGQGGMLYLQQPDGSFIPAKSQPWKADAKCDDVGSVFFDADGDGNMDLYVVSGGSEYTLGSPELQDRLYINDGKGNFKKAPEGALPKEFSSGSCVAASDYNHDGKMDLYVGGRVNPGFYPLTSPGGILKNVTDPKTHKVKFVVATDEVNPELRLPGMVTDAVWADIDNDGWDDLIITGEWMPIMIFKNNKGKLIDITAKCGLQKSNGLWNSLTPCDLNDDGKVDFIAGNIGANTQWNASVKQPLTMYAIDFNNNGKIEPVICNYTNGTSYPIASRDELVGQFPALNYKFLRYADYADAKIDDIFTRQQLDNAKVFYAYTLKTSYLKNMGNGKFSIQPLPNEAQFSVVQRVIAHDFNNDGHPDVLVTGNYFPFRVQYGPSDASVGLLLKGDGKGGLIPVRSEDLGVYIGGDVRDAVMLNQKGRPLIIVTKNNDKVQVVKSN